MAWQACSHPDFPKVIVPITGEGSLQNGLIDQGQLVAAFQAWTLDKASWK